MLFPNSTVTDKQHLIARKAFLCGTFFLILFVNSKPQWKIYTKPINFLLEEIER